MKYRFQLKFSCYKAVAAMLAVPWSSRYVSQIFQICKNLKTKQKQNLVLRFFGICLVYLASDAVSATVNQHICYVSDRSVYFLGAFFSGGVLIFFPFPLKIAALFLLYRSFITPALCSSLCFPLLRYSICSIAIKCWLRAFRWDQNLHEIIMETVNKSFSTLSDDEVVK